MIQRKDRGRFGGRALLCMGKTDNKLQRCIETLCQDGCRQVTRYIRLLKTGAALPGYEQLTAIERRDVLQELESIMSVYDRSCGD